MKEERGMRKILIFLLILIILGGGVFLFKELSKEKEKTSFKETLKKREVIKEKEISLRECEKIPFLQDFERTLCFIKLGEKEKDIEICKKIEDLRDKAYCFGGVAGAKKDLEIYKEFEKEVGKEFSLIAKNLVPPYVTWNFSSRGIPLGLPHYDFVSPYFLFNPPLVEGGDALGPAMMYAIYTPFFIGASLVAQDEKFCEFPEKSFLSVYFNKSDPLYPLFCKDRVVILRAFSKKDPKICEKISIKEISLKEKLLAFCYSSIAIQTGEIELCEKIEKEEGRGLCFSLIARGKGSPEICDKISDSFAKDTCLFDVAFATSQREICKKIQYLSIRKDCFFSVSGKLFAQGKLPYFCEKIDKELQNECKRYLRESFYTLKNPSPCETIKDKDLQEECYSFVAQNTKGK